MQHRTQVEVRRILDHICEQVKLNKRLDTMTQKQISKSNINYLRKHRLKIQYHLSTPTEHH